MVVGRPHVSTKLKEIAIRWLENVQFWLLPGTCVLCGRLSGQRLDLCEACHAQLRHIEQACQRCALPLPSSLPPTRAHEAADTGLCAVCLSNPAPFHHAAAPLAWAEPASTLISRFKYNADLASGRVLGTLLGHELGLHYALPRRLLPRTSQPPTSMLPTPLLTAPLPPMPRLPDSESPGCLALPELILPVPLHPARLRRRGYNQSLLLAQQLARQLQRPCAANLLLRVRDTPPQQELSREERLQNLKGAFGLNRQHAALRTPVRSIALVDDVVTTQSTARAVAEVLLQAWTPAPELHLWALARA